VYRTMTRTCALTLVCLLALGACGFQAPEPKRTPPPAPPTPPLSTVSATLRIPAAEILTLLNEKTKSQLARIDDSPVNCFITKCQLNLIASRTGEITGEAVGSGMHLKLPFALKAQLDLKSKFLKTGGQARADGLADATVQLTLKPDWRVESQTQGDVHLSNAKLDLGPLKMSVTELWNHNQDHLSQPIFKALDKRVVGAIRVRSQAERLWRKVQQPIKIGKDPESWLLLSPQRLRVTPIRTEGNALVLAFAADVRAHVMVGQRPPDPKTIPKLPPAGPLDAGTNSFAVSMPLLLPYGEAARLATARLKKHPLRAGGSEIEIEKLQILPSGQDVVVAARFCVEQSWDFTHLLDACGEGFLRGVPKFDVKTSQLRIDNVHYDIRTRDLLLTILHAIAGDEFGKALQAHLVFDEGREIRKLEDNIRAALAKPQGRGVEITGRIDSFGGPTLGWTKDGFIALFTAKGTVSANLDVKGGPK